MADSRPASKTSTGSKKVEMDLKRDSPVSKSVIDVTVVPPSPQVTVNPPTRRESDSGQRPELKSSSSEVIRRGESALAQRSEPGLYPTPDSSCLPEVCQKTESKAFPSSPARRSAVGFKKVCGKLSRVDKAISRKMAVCAQNGPLAFLRPLMILLELSCHGLVWLPGPLVVILFTNYPDQEMLCNLFIGLMIDVMAIGVLKNMARRRRPSINTSNMFATVALDKYSFPSGHASRAVFVSIFFSMHLSECTYCVTGWSSWASAVALSRIVMGRHHVFDVLVGAALGTGIYLLILNYWNMGVLMAETLAPVKETISETLMSLGIEV